MVKFGLFELCALLSSSKLYVMNTNNVIFKKVACRYSDINVCQAPLLDSSEVESIFVNSIEMLPNIPHFYKLWWSNETIPDDFEMEVTFKTLAIVKSIHTAWSIEKIEYSLYDSQVMETLDFNTSGTFHM